MKSFARKLALIAALSIMHRSFAADPTAPVVAPDEVLGRLKAGNERFVSVKESASKRTELGALASQGRIVEGYYHLDTGKVGWTAK